MLCMVLVSWSLGQCLVLANAAASCTAAAASTLQAPCALLVLLWAQASVRCCACAAAGSLGTAPAAAMRGRRAALVLAAWACSRHS
jgi:hypothetical protein